MATSPLRTFADLRQYQAAAAQPTQNPLDALIQGYSQGQQLQQLPQIQAEQALAKQLQNALIVQKLQDLQNPEAALARKIQEELTVKSALNPDLGIVTAPAGLEGQTIFSPGATNQTAATLEQALTANPQTALPTAAAAALPETPISLLGIQTGLNTNPNIPAQAIETKISNQIRLANARAAALGEPVEYFTQLDGTTGMRPRRIIGGVAPIATTLKTDTGEAAKELPKPTKGAGAGGALTENARSKIIRDYTDLTGLSAGKVLDDLNDGTISIDKMNATVGSLQGSRKIPTTEFKSFNALQTLKTDFEKAEKAIKGLEDQFGPISGRWNEFLLKYDIAESDPRVAEAFALINSLSADQIHEKYGGALTGTENARATKWALDTSLPFQTLKSRIKVAKGGIDSSTETFKKSLKARRINAPELFEEDSSVTDSQDTQEIPPGYQLERNKKTGKTRLAPIQ